VRRSSALTRLCALAWLVAVGCGPTLHDRARLFNEDGVYLYQKGDYTGARQSFEAALRVTPEDPTLLYNLGQCHDRQGAAERAEKAYKACLNADANHAASRHALVTLMLRQGRREEADGLVDGWLASEPKRAEAYVQDGWRLRQDGDLLQAQARLQQALELDPDNPRALVELGILYELMERPGRALVLYEKALRHDPNQADVARRAEALRARGVKSPLPD
jgi:Tfp pilus assembly protein PilF